MKLPIPRGRRAILIIGVPLGLAAAGAFVFTQVIMATPAPVPDPAAGKHGPMLVLESRVINLQQNVPSDLKYAKVAVTVEMRPTDAKFYDLTGAERAKAEKTQLDGLSDDTPLLQDALLQVIGSHSSSDIATPQGRAALKTELLAAMRKACGDRAVLNVYFTDFTMT